MQVEQDEASLACYALPISEEERGTWGKKNRKAIPSEKQLIDDSDARLHSYAPDAETVSIRLNPDPVPIYCKSLEIQLSLPQLKKWLLKQGITMQCERTIVAVHSGTFIADGDGNYTVPVYHLKPSSL